MSATASVKEALEEVAGKAAMVKVLGSLPQSVRPVLQFSDRDLFFLQPPVGK